MNNIQTIHPKECLDYEDSLGKYYGAAYAFAASIKEHITELAEKQADVIIQAGDGSGDMSASRLVNNAISWGRNNGHETEDIRIRMKYMLVEHILDNVRQQIVEN